MRFLLIVFLGFNLAGQGQQIEKLNPPKEVLSFLYKTDSSRYYLTARGKDSFNIHHIPLHTGQYYGAHVEDCDSIPSLRGLCIGYHYNGARQDFDFIEHYDTLDFKYGSFIERSRPGDYYDRI